MATTWAFLPALKQQLNITGTASDGELARMLGVGNEVVTGLVEGLGGFTGTERATAVNGMVVLRHRPAGAVTLTTSTGGAITGFAVDAVTGILYDVPYSGVVNAAYTSTGVVPVWATEVAALMVAARLWETQRGNTPTILQGDDAGAPFTPGLGGIITEARALLEAAVPRGPVTA